MHHVEIRTYFQTIAHSVYAAISRPKIPYLPCFDVDKSKISYAHHLSCFPGLQPIYLVFLFGD
jgi:hypothetical protein